MDEVQTIDMSGAPWFQWCHSCQAFYPIGETTDDRPCTTCGKTFKDQL
jgi:hypothetical protein